jgi:hypothetical protein
MIRRLEDLPLKDILIGRPLTRNETARKTKIQMGGWVDGVKSEQL